MNDSRFRYITSNIIAQKLYKLPGFLTLIFILSTSIATASEESNKCTLAISKYEEKYNIPKGLLKAISNAESSFNPYALNDRTRNYNLRNKADVLNIITSLIKDKKYNFDVGCMQLNYKWHSKHFSSASEMLDVNANVRYGAAYLYSLYKTHDSWHKAVRFYHSYNPKHYLKYSNKIALLWVNQ